MYTAHRDERKYDPLLARSEKADEIAIAYYVSSDISKEIKDELVNATYSSTILDSNMVQKINSDKVLRSQLFNLVIKLLLERDLYHRTITSHFKRHKIYGYRRTGLHAGI